MLLHYNEACIYILKMNDGVVSPTEQSIRYMKEDKDNKEVDENILDNLENTIVYKLDELRSFKISPVRNESTIKVEDDTPVTAQTVVTKQIDIFANEEEKEEESMNEMKDAVETLEEEISKTMYINDLK